MTISAKYTFLIINSKVDKHGDVPIYGRITINGLREQFYTGLRIDPNKWQNGRVKGSTTTANIINEELDNIKSRLYRASRDLVDEGHPITAKAIKHKLEQKKSGSKTIVSLFENYNIDLATKTAKDFAKSTLKRYQTTLRHLKDYLESQYSVEDLPLSELDFKFISGFEHYFKYIRDCNHNTSIKYVRNLRRVINWARDHNWILRDPFARYKSKVEETDRPYLQLEEIKKIEEKILSNKRLDEVRDIFIFCCYTGMAFIDVFNLTIDDVQLGENKKYWIKKRRTKTGSKAQILLMPPALKIIKKYAMHRCREKGKLLPVKSNQKYNSYLKELADLCGINKNLSSHVARHSCATFFIEKGIPMETVKEILGHKNIRNTHIYGRILGTKIVDDTKHLYNELEKGTKKTR